MSLAGRSALCIVVALAVVATTVVVAPSIAMYVIKTNVARRARTCTSITWPCAANLAISARTRPCGQDCTPTRLLQILRRHRRSRHHVLTKRPTPRPPTKDPTRELTKPPKTDPPTNKPVEDPTAQPRVEATPMPVVTTAPTPTTVPIQMTGGNDSCQGALGPLVLGSTGSTVDATTDAVPACAGSSTAGTFAGVWYTVQGTGGTLMASTCTGTELDTGYESQISIWQGTCDSLQCVAGDHNTDISCVSESSVSWPTISGQLYYILVHGQTSTPGTFGITVKGNAVGARIETSGVQSFYLSSSIRMVLIIGALYVRYV